MTDYRWTPLSVEHTTAWSELCNHLAVVDGTEEFLSPEDLAEELQAPHHDPATDSWAVWHGEQMVGYATVFVPLLPDHEERARAYHGGGVHADHRARGLGSRLVDTAEARGLELLRERTGLPLTEAPDHFAAQAAPDALVEVSSQLRGAAVALTKIANDIRWMASGPRTGLGEILLPDLQPGSSIMPGKVNPVLCEAVTQVAAQVIGNDAAVAFGGSQGNFELNVYMPMMARNLLESGTLLANASAVFASRMIDGIEANEEVCREYAESSPSIGTSLNPYIGYELAAEVIKESTRTGESIRSIVLERELMTDEELDRALDVISMTKGGIVK